jgi:hypothetical protein
MFRFAKYAGMVAFSLTFAAGCQTSRRSPYADNPLLLSREPLLQSSSQASAKSAVVSNPPKQFGLRSNQPLINTRRPMAGHSSTVTAAPLPESPKAASDGQSMTIKPPPPESIVAPPLVKPEADKAAEPDFVPSPAPPVLPTPPAPRPTSPPIVPVSYQRLSNAPDYSWLQGELDIHYRGYKELRFRSSDEEDSIGGKVRLVDDPRLSEFKAGDIIRVEGDLVKEDLNGRGGQYPRFHVRSVQLVERKSGR